MTNGQPTDIKSGILLVFPDGPHTTNCVFQTIGEIDLGQLQIGADLLTMEKDASFAKIRTMVNDPNRRRGLFVPGKQ